MKYGMILSASIIYIAFPLAMITAACGGAGENKTENTAQTATEQDKPAVSNQEPAPAPENAAATQETTASAAKEATTQKAGQAASAKSQAASPAEKSKMAETTQAAKPAAEAVKPTTVEQQKSNTEVQHAPAPKIEEAKVISPAPAPAPIAVEKPKTNSQGPATDPGKWAVPEKDKNRPNPVKADAESLSLGKSLYIKHCASCHGKKGHGDGSKAAQLDTKCGDFTLASFKNQSDGAIFYKIMEGRDDMPAFKKKLPDAGDVWSIVHFLKSL